MSGVQSDRPVHQPSAHRLADVTPTDSDKASSKPTAAKSKADPGLWDSPSSNGLDELDATIKLEFYSLGKFEIENVMWHHDHSGPDHKGWDQPNSILENDNQLRRMTLLENKILADMKDEIHLRLGLPRPDYGQRIRSIKDELFEKFGHADVVERATSEIIHEIEALSAVKMSFDVYIESIEATRIPVNSTRSEWNKYWPAYGQSIIALKKLHADIYSFIYGDVSLSKTPLPQLENDIAKRVRAAAKIDFNNPSDNYDRGIGQAIHRTVLKITSQKVVDKRADTLLENIPTKDPNFPDVPSTHIRMAELILRYDPKLAQEIKSNSLYKQIIKDFVETCFEAAGSPQSVEDITWQLDSAATWISERDTARRARCRR
jgi:hypothetical protein